MGNNYFVLISDWTNQRIAIWFDLRFAMYIWNENLEILTQLNEVPAKTANAYSNHYIFHQYSFVPNCRPPSPSVE